MICTEAPEPVDTAPGPQNALEQGQGAEFVRRAVLAPEAAGSITWKVRSDVADCWPEGFDDDTTTPNRTEAELAVNTIAELFKTT